MVRERTLLVVRNPRARTAPSEGELIEATRPLSAAGWEVEVRTTSAPGHGELLAREAAGAGTSIVVACGGDGTVREVAAGLLGSESALGVIRGGTANVWAREAGVPAGVRAALASMLRARRYRVDVGVARLDGGAAERFLLMCGAGIDAAVLRAVDEGGRKARWGRAAFAWPAVHAVTQARPVDALVGVDGEVASRHPLLLLVAGNSRLYGGVLRLTPEALMDDGRLDLRLFAAATGRARVALAARALLHGVTGRLGDGPGIESARGTSITVEAEAGLPVQVDGEYLGMANRLELWVEPRSLVVLIGGRGRGLIGTDGEA